MWIRYHLMDTDNGGIKWGDWSEAEIPDTEDPREIAEALNRANWEAVAEAPLGADEDPPKTLLAAAGDELAGIAWIEDREGQGATSVVIEWRHRFGPPPD